MVQAHGPRRLRSPHRGEGRGVRCEHCRAANESKRKPIYADELGRISEAWRTCDSGVSVSHAAIVYGGGENSGTPAWRPSSLLECSLEANKLLVREPSGPGGSLEAPYSVADWQRMTGRKWKEDLPPWLFEAWHYILSRELNLPYQPPRWLKQPAAMTVPISTPQVMERLGCFKNDLRPFTVVTVPFPKKEINQQWTGSLIMPYSEKLDDLHGQSYGEQCQRRNLLHLR